MLIFGFIFGLLFFVFIPSVLAMVPCPVCAVATGSMLYVSRYLGLDDSVTSLWIGAFIVVLIKLTFQWLDKLKIKFKFRKLLITFLYYFFIFFYFIKNNYIGIATNKIGSIDKIVFGILLGSFAFLLGMGIQKNLKMRNDLKSYFPFQPVIVPLAPVVFFTLVLYFVTR